MAKALPWLLGIGAAIAAGIALAAAKPEKIPAPPEEIEVTLIAPEIAPLEEEAPVIPPREITAPIEVPLIFPEIEYAKYREPRPEWGVPRPLIIKEKISEPKWLEE